MVVLADDVFRNSTTAIVVISSLIMTVVPYPITLPLLHREAATYSALDFYRITVEVQLAIYNSIILAWKEKV